jgi:hypothetical protein
MSVTLRGVNGPLQENEFMAAAPLPYVIHMKLKESNDGTSFNGVMLLHKLNTILLVG